MPSACPFPPASRAALLAALLLAAAVPACGGADGGGGEGAESAAGFENGGEPARIEVDPCGLLTKEELSEQLFLSVSPSERGSWASPEFDISSNEPQLGTSRLCEYRFESRYAVGGGPVWHSDFSLTVFPSNAIALAEEKREPIEGGSREMFRERGASTVYVVKGPHAVSVTGFPGRDDGEPGGPDAGRLVLLRHIAERLP